MPGEVDIIVENKFIKEKTDIIKIPPGPPTWQLKMTMPNGISSKGPLTGDHVTVGDG